MKVYIVIPVCIFMLMALFSCSKDAIETPLGSIAGSVSDQTTGEPVATVNVSINPGGGSTVTGSDGTFWFRNLDEGNYTLSIHKEGYKQNSGSFFVKTGDPTSAHLLIERIPASLTPDKTLLDFGENLTTLSFTIVNSGYTDLAYKIETGGCVWMSVEPETDILGYGKTTTIVVTIDRTKLPNGDNEANIVVQSTSGNGNVEVKVKAINNANAAVNTFDATDITKTTATLNGEIINAGTPTYTERGFVYDTQSTPTVSACIRKLSSPVTSENKFSCNIDGLSPEKTYYVRTYIVQNGNTIYGNIVSFSTSKQTTTISTSAVTHIGASTATFNASILDVGAPAYTERGFCYSKGNSPTIADNRKLVNGLGMGDFSLSVTDLEYPVTYYVRAYAIQAGNPVYGNAVSFTTEFRTVSVSTSAATDISTTSVKLNGVINDVGSPTYTQRGFCYSSTNTNPTIADSKTVKYISSAGNYNEKISNLQEGTTYYVRAFAVQDNQYVYGNTISFTTSSLPSVRTDAVTSLTKVDLFGGGFFYQWRATFNATVLSAGSPAYSGCGFVYGTTMEPTSANGNSISLTGSGTGRFSAIVDNLSDMQIYYVRAYVKVGNKYYYGESVRISTF